MRLMKNSLKTSSIVYITAALCFLAFLFCPFRILQFILLSILGILLLSFFYALMLYKKIKIERNVSEVKLSCGETAEISFTIKNFSRLTAHLCYFFDEIPYVYVFEDANQIITSLKGRELKYVTYKIKARERGIYHAGPVKVKTGDPLGLFQIDMEVPADLKIVVRPARIKLTTETQPGFPQGNLKINNPVYEDVTMRRSIREYKNGDEQKRINWRASAKFGTLFTNQFENSYNSPFFIFLNIAKEDYELHSRNYNIEKAIEIAASIAEKAIFYRQRCGFSAFAEGYPFLRPTPNSALTILDILSVIKPIDGKCGYDPYMKFKNQLPAGTLFFEIGPKEVEEYFLKLAADKHINTKNIGALKKNGK